MSDGRLWLADAPLLLASTSRTRRDLIASAGLPVETEPPGIDERALQDAMGPAGPAEVARRLAELKASVVSGRHPDRVVVGADQVLVCEGRLLSKPPDAAGARTQLASLAGRSHALHSAAAIARGGAVEACFVVEARLAMRFLSAREIGSYVALAGPAATRSVGGYEIEGLGIHLFDRIEGEHSTILGLPLLPLLATLRGMGLLGL